MKDFVVLVDENDNQIGVEEKMQAHIDGKLHRAFSIFVFNSKGEVLLQQRALEKYHSGGLWTNTCCSHPRPEEETLSAAHRRLGEEMGFDCDLSEAFSFTYKTLLDKGLTEHELDHVIIGKYEGIIQANPSEVSAYKWVSMEWLSEDLKNNKEQYTVWLQICFEQVLKYDHLSMNGEMS